MPKVLLLQFATDPEAHPRRQALQATGATVVEAEPRWPTFFDCVYANRPDDIVIAASYMPTYGFEAARYLGEGFNTRDIPVFLVDVDPKNIDKAKTSAPLAKIVSRDQLASAFA